MNGQRSVFLNVLPEEIGHYCFVPGSVERAELIAERFDHPRKIMHCREFLTYTGELDGETVTVTSTG
ncbi:MAG: uridine phosphorylase, partial [Clostridiales bacterium]|nr:uridine phosphorylase [Clostridiales bacterium]